MSSKVTRSSIAGAAALFSFTLLFFTPLQIYLTNAVQLPFSIGDIFLPFLGIAVAVFIVLATILILLPSRISMVGVVILLALERRRRLIVKVGVPGDEPDLDSLTALWPGANFYEREAYDLFGLHFVGHPDLTRILLPDDWEGHPLRKDYSVGSVPVQFKGAHQTP